MTSVGTSSSVITASTCVSTFGASSMLSAGGDTPAGSTSSATMVSPVISFSARLAASACSTAVWISSAIRCKAMTSRSSKAYGLPENNSKTPFTSFSRISGITMTDAIPRARQLSRFTRASFSASSQRKICLVRTLSPDRPESICRRVPSSGADGPALARQSIFSPSRKAMAAPEAPVMYCARSASNCKVALRSRCAISVSELPSFAAGKRKVARALSGSRDEDSPSGRGVWGTSRGEP